MKPTKAGIESSKHFEMKTKKGEVEKSVRLDRLPPPPHKSKAFATS